MPPATILSVRRTLLNRRHVFQKRLIATYNLTVKHRSAREASTCFINGTYPHPHLIARTNVIHRHRTQKRRPLIGSFAGKVNQSLCPLTTDISINRPRSHKNPNYSLAEATFNKWYSYFAHQENFIYLRIIYLATRRSTAEHHSVTLRLQPTMT